MRVLILSVTAGAGHHATAQAIESCFAARGVTVHTLDVYAYVSNLVKQTIDKGYLFSSKHMQVLYRLIYQMAESTGPYFTTAPSMINIVNAIGASKFAKLLTGYQPDAIICTHVFAAQMINELKKRKKLADILSYGIVTDYTLHPYWETIPRVQFIVTASELLTYSCVKRGIPAERVLPFGIPIHPKYNQRITREQAAAALQIEADRPTILLMGGSMGYNDHVKTVQALSKLDLPLQLLVVCGNNKRLLSEVERLGSEVGGCTVYPYGFANNIEVMMSAADCVVTKPGGLTTSEALSKCLPMLLTDPIPGHEERNVEFFVNNGMAAQVTKTYPIDDAVLHLLTYPARLSAMREMMVAVSHPDAAARLADHVMQQVPRLTE